MSRTSTAPTASTWCWATRSWRSTSRPASPTTASGNYVNYDSCVLATGSAPFVPPIPGTDAAGVFVYRTIDDLDAIQAWALRAPHAASSSAAGCSAWRRPTPCACSGSTTTVVEFAPRLMAVQLDDGGGRALRRHVEALGLHRAHRGGGDGSSRPIGGQRRRARRSPTGRTIDADLVVFAAGIRPRDQLGRDAGLAIGERGGIVVDDACATSAPGRLRHRRGRLPRRSGLRPRRLRATRWPRSSPTGCAGGGGDVHRRRHVDQAQAARRRGGQRRRPARRRRRGRRRRPGGRHVAEGRARPDGQGARRRAGRRHRAVRDAGAAARGAVDADRPGRAAAPSGAGGPRAPPARPTCPTTPASARATTSPAGRSAPRSATASSDVAGVKACTQAGTGCGSCVPLLQELIDAQLRAAGKAVVKRLCEHFAMTRPGAVRDRAGAAASARSPSSSSATAPGGAARSASRPWPRCSPRWRTATSSTASRPACRTPTTTSWPTSSATAPTRSCPGCRAARSPRTQLIAIGEVAQRLRPLHQDHRRPAHRPVRRPRRAAAADLGAAASTPASSRATPTARRCAP